MLPRYEYILLKKAKKKKHILLDDHVNWKIDLPSRI